MLEIYELSGYFFQILNTKTGFFINSDLIVCLWRESGRINYSLTSGHVLITVDWNRILETVLKRRHLFTFLIGKKICNMFD